MRYNYSCTKGCTLKALLEADIVTPDKDFFQVKSGNLVWEETHGMTEDPKIKCPLCGKKAAKTMEGMSAPVFYFPGNCYLNKEECRKQMDLHALESGNDPFAAHRQPGEVDHIKDKLRRNKKPKKYFGP
jgi:predicted nucleic acid-binding Zn ribbon protein